MAASLDHMAMLASALSGRDIKIANTDPGSPAWTDGNVIYVDADADIRSQLQQLCVQSSLLAAGSLDREFIRRLARRPKVANRYLAIEGARAMSTLSDILPSSIKLLINESSSPRSTSSAASLELALSKADIADPPLAFGVIRANKLIAAEKHAGGAAGEGRHIPRKQEEKALTELPDDANEDEEDTEDFASSPVGGGGGLGKMLQKMFQMVRQVKGGGTPGADAATHWSRSGSRAGVRALSSDAEAGTVEDAFGKGRGFLYPEWNVHSQAYRDDWCTVLEVDAPTKNQASVEWLKGVSLRRPLSQLGMEPDRFRRRAQGDDIDVDAAIESQIELIAGTVPDEFIYIESQRLRRDLSVMILLDISGSVSQVSQSGMSVHEQQRGVAAELATVLYEIGDRVALYAFHSQGRTAVNMVPVKRFDDNLDSLFMTRLNSLIPGAYSRLGAAIRHGTKVITEQGGTSRRLLVVLSDGLAYDHGYEPAYGAADARRALSDARRDGIGCLCLSLGANTDAEALRRVFGSAAFATIPKTEQLGRMIGPLFRSALKAAEVQRRVA
ncbi:nitric oxide reductase activation protein NorD [Ketobacter sp.]